MEKIQWELHVGKLFLHLFHGRKDPDQDMQDWGDDGPVFGPLAYVHTTYANDIKVKDAKGKDFVLRTHEDMLYYDGVYYGDWSMFFCKPDTPPFTNLQELDQAKAELPNQSVPIVHGLRISNGRCHDCGCGTGVGVPPAVFEFFQEDPDADGHWFCTYCGSNHVTVTVNGVTTEQGDLN